MSRAENAPGESNKLGSRKTNYDCKWYDTTKTEKKKKGGFDDLYTVLLPIV